MPVAVAWLDAVEHDPGGVAAFLAGDHRRADALAPDLQLLDRGGAEGVAGGEQHAIILLLEPVAELADGGGLARAVDADHQDHVRAREAPDFERLGDRREDLLDLLGEDGAKAALVELLEALRGDRLADPARRLGAEVGGDQRLLDVVERRRVERRRGDQAGEIVGDPLRGLGEPAAQAVEPAHAQTADQLVAVAAGDARLADVAALGAGDRDRRESVAVALAVALDQHGLGGADQAVEPCAPPRRRRLAQPGGAGLDRSSRSTCGMRAAGVSGRGEKGKMCAATMSQSSSSLQAVLAPSLRFRSGIRRSGRRRSSRRGARP